MWLITLSALVSVAKCDETNSVNVKNVNGTCVSSMSCIQRLANQVIDGLSEHKSVDFGAFAIDPVENKVKNSATTGRSHKFSDFINGNSIRIPIGPAYLTIQKAEEYDNYFEIAVLRKAGEGDLKYNLICESEW